MPTIVEVEYPQLPIVAEKGKYYYRGIILVKYCRKEKSNQIKRLKTQSLYQSLRPLPKIYKNVCGILVLYNIAKY